MSNQPNNLEVLEDRKSSIHQKGEAPFAMRCESRSIAGSVSQRACVFCGSRVVLYPIADALHLVHGPVGCAAYTWDIRGALSSGPELHRLSFSTDLREQDVIYGGEKKLYRALVELIDAHAPKAAFVYATCIVGIIGDDVEAICRRVGKEKGIAVIPVRSEGFSGTKKTGYRAACDALGKLIGTGPTNHIPAHSINIIGEFNLAGEAWIIREYYRRLGVHVAAILTGDGRIQDICSAHGAALNVVQCSGSMIDVAKMMQQRFNIPFVRVSYFGIEDMADALYQVADHFADAPAIRTRAEELVRDEVSRIMPELMRCRARLQGRTAAIYTGGAFKAFSLVRSLRTLGIRTVIAGSQTGNQEDYQLLRDLCDDGAVLIDDTNPLELSKFVRETGADMLIGGVKERPIAYKMGIGFVDHNHERKEPLAGFEGMLNFAREVESSLCSPVWAIRRLDGPGRRITAS